MTANRKIGCFPIGKDQVDLYLRSGTGGEFQTFPEKGRLPRITVGSDEKDSLKFYEVLYHEALEFALTRQHLRYNPTIETTNSADYMFIFDHQQMHYVAMALAEFSVYGLTIIGKARRAWVRDHGG